MRFDELIAFAIGTNFCLLCLLVFLLAKTSDSQKTGRESPFNHLIMWTACKQITVSAVSCVDTIGWHFRTATVKHQQSLLRAQVFEEFFVSKMIKQSLHAHRVLRFAQLSQKLESLQPSYLGG